MDDKSYNEEMIEKIRTYAENGMKVDEMLEELGLTHRQYRAIRNSFGYGRTWYSQVTEDGRRKKLSVSIIPLIKQGKLPVEVAKELGIQMKTLKDILIKCLESGELGAPHCDACGKEHDYRYGQCRFCSSECARSFSTRNMSDESHQKRIDGLKKGHEIESALWEVWREEESRAGGSENIRYPIKTVIDGKEYHIQLRTEPGQKSGFSKEKGVHIFYIFYGEENGATSMPEYIKRKISESLKYRWENDEEFAKEQIELIRSLQTGKPLPEETKRKISEAHKQRVADGLHIGWSTRSNVERSYAENYWETFLNLIGLEEDVHYVHEFVISKKSLGLNSSACYFLDFLITCPDGTLFDFEVDGKQHMYPDRQQSDKARDALLRANGYTVHRILWENPRDRKGKDTTIQDKHALVQHLNLHGFNLDVSKGL